MYGTAAAIIRVRQTTPGNGLVWWFPALPDEWRFDAPGSNRLGLPMGTFSASHAWFRMIPHVSPDLVSPDLVLPDLVSPDLVSPDLVLPDLVSPDLVSPDPVIMVLCPLLAVSGLC